MQALYTFDGGAGATVYDTSGAGTALDLTIGDTNNVTWLASDEVTLEAWVQPADDTQSLSRILALAEDRTYRDVMLAQACTERSECDGDEYQLRVRTTDTDDSGNPKFETAGACPEGTEGAVVTGQPQHVVYTRDSAGNEVIYLDGVSTATGTRDGTLDNWATDHELCLANEESDDREWRGDLHLLAARRSHLGGAGAPSAAW